MDLYSSLFNFFEESDISVDKDRREFLRDMGRAGAILGGGKIAEPALKEQVQNFLYEDGYSGVPERYIEDQMFQENLDELYVEGFPGFDRSRPNVLIDVIEVGDNYLQQDVVNTIESVYDDNGINAIIGRREQKYPENRFQQYYGGDAAKILGTSGYNGFAQDQISPKLRASAIQVVVSPGKLDNPEGWLEYIEDDGEKMHRTGFANDSIALGADNAFQEGYSEDYIEGKTRVFLHELGHAHGLTHPDEGKNPLHYPLYSKDPSNVMHSGVNLRANTDFRSEEWDIIKHNLEG